MSADNTHRKFILLGSTLIERTLDLTRIFFDGSLPKAFAPRPHPMSFDLWERMNRLRIMISSFLQESEAQTQLAMICTGILNTSRVLVDQILTLNVAQLCERQCPASLMLGFFIQSMMRMLASMEDLISMAIASQGCEHSDCDLCLQSLREDWSDVQADHNSVKLYLLVTFIQRNEFCLPRRLIVEMVHYAQVNYGSHCPRVYSEALDALKLGHNVVLPISLHFLQE